MGFYKGTAKLLWEYIYMVVYIRANVKLSEPQFNKLKTAAKDHIGVALRMNIKMFNRNNLPHELLFTKRQTQN